MLQHFFRLNTPFVRFDQSKFVQQLQVSKHICNVLYEADVLEYQTINGVRFENVSFAKTVLKRLTFNGCRFIDCLFIGTAFESIDLHDCSFENCNFYKSSFQAVYAKPRQFRRAVTDKQYANIAVHLYHQLRLNYYTQSQREFKNEAEYYFGHWSRRNDLQQATRNHKHLYQYLPQFIVSWLYGYLFGYGFVLRNVILTACAVTGLAVLLNYHFAPHLFSTPTEPSVIKTVYFTIATMATLGASGYSPDTEVGYMVVVANVVVGLFILSNTINAIFKKVVR